ncbi:hypothetical protein A2U01_0074157, partial [Trifolium medium]|nr:hypothetical protein [Trifolium medium]
TLIVKMNNFWENCGEETLLINIASLRRNSATGNFSPFLALWDSREHAEALCRGSLEELVSL